MSDSDSDSDEDMDGPIEYCECDGGPRHEFCRDCDAAIYYDDDDEYGECGRCEAYLCRYCCKNKCDHCITDTARYSEMCHRCAVVCQDCKEEHQEGEPGAKIFVCHKNCLKLHRKEWHTKSRKQRALAVLDETIKSKKEQLTSSKEQLESIQREIATLENDIAVVESDRAKVEKQEEDETELAKGKKQEVDETEQGKVKKQKVDVMEQAKVEKMEAEEGKK